MNPAMSSFVSGNGPSVTVRFEPENRTRAPRELGVSPVPSSMIPALINSSMNLSMAANISGSISPASDAFDALDNHHDFHDGTPELGGWVCD